MSKTAETQYDIVKEKEQLIDKLRAQRVECQKKLDSCGSTDDWRGPVLLLVVCLAISYAASLLVVGGYRPVVFIACYLGIAVSVSYLVVKIRETPFKAELNTLDSEIEESLIELARIKRRIG